MFDDILVPLDGSEAAESALGHAVGVVRATGAALHVLRVIRSGRTGSPEFEIGSTAFRVVQTAGTSVLLVRPCENHGPRPDGDGYRRVLVPVDGSSRGEWAVCLGSTLVSASPRGELILVHVVPVPEMVTRIPANEELDSLRGRIVEASHRPLLVLQDEPAGDRASGRPAIAGGRSRAR